MPVIAPQLPHRLARDPSLAAELRQAIIYASVPLLIAALAGWAWLRDPAGVPAWFRYAGVVLGIVLIALMWNAAARARRLWRGTAPVVEVSLLPWRPGQPLDVRVADHDAASVESVEVYLAAEDIKVERMPMTTVSDSGWRFTEVVRHQVRLLSVPKNALRMEGFRLDRTVSAEVPAELAEHNWRWVVLIVGPVARGMPRVDRYPLWVGPSAWPSSLSGLSPDRR